MSETESIRVLDRAFAVLGVLAESGEAMGISEIARRTELSKATVFRLLATLCASNVALKDRNGLYQMGPAVLYWANSFRKQSGLVELSRPSLKTLWLETSETIHLFTFDRGQAYYLDKLESPHPVRMQSRIGSSLLLYCTAAGRAILSRLPDEEREAYFRGAELLPRTERTETDPARLRERIAVARERGFAEENQENEEGIRCVGAAILDSREYPIGAVSVSAPAYRFGDELLEGYGDRVARATREISARFGRQEAHRGEASGAE
jgi:DNA-binding IclR family transcriptional regulator